MQLVRQYILQRVVLFVLLLLSVQTVQSQQQYNTDPAALIKSFTKWWTYHYTQIKLSSDFIPYDVDGRQIDKASFLQSIITGKYIPVALQVDVRAYRLYPLGDDADADIRATVMTVVGKDYAYFLKEGTSFPTFGFEGLNGQLYNNTNTNGKILVLKCWFINCVPCVAEMPALNQWMKAYKKRDDILFLSVAFDAKEDLRSFLKRVQFNFITTRVDQSFLENTVGVSGYPTHILINKEGVILKMVNKHEELDEVLRKL